MSAPYLAACLLAGLVLVGVFCLVRKMGKLRNLKVTAQIAKIFSLSVEATSDSTAPPAAGDSRPHDSRLSPRHQITRPGYPARPAGGPGNRR